jgi:hypothetical protein
MMNFTISIIGLGSGVINNLIIPVVILINDEKIIMSINSHAGTPRLNVIVLESVGASNTATDIIIYIIWIFIDGINHITEALKGV